jgi:hypothetical protein
MTAEIKPKELDQERKKTPETKGEVYIAPKFRPHETLFDVGDIIQERHFRHRWNKVIKDQTAEQKETEGPAVSQNVSSAQKPMVNINDIIESSGSVETQPKAANFEDAIAASRSNQ